MVYFKMLPTSQTTTAERLVSDILEML